VDYYEQVIAERTARRMRHEESRHRSNTERSRTNPRRRAPSGAQPFCGIDGEGGGKDELGRQPYRLLRAHGGGIDEVLFRGNEPLGAQECLEFIAALPPEPIYVAYGLGYDATQILRGLPQNIILRLLEPRPPNQISHYIYWKNYAIDYLAGQYLAVGRVNWRYSAAHDREIPYYIKGSARKVLEVLGFFQCKFTDSLTTWGVGSAEIRAEIEGFKRQRDQFGLLTPEQLRYNKMECRWLATLMEGFRHMCEGVDLHLPKNMWNGPGKLAAKLMRQHNIPRREWIEQHLHARLRDAAKHAYFGGRAELARPGGCWKVYAYDLKSAYPAAMRGLPCLVHGTWHQIDAKAAAALPEGAIAMLDVEYSHPAETLWTGLPWRFPDGYLQYPRFGAGIYWAIELSAAVRNVGTVIKRYNGGWLYEKRCDCQPFDFVEPLFIERQRLDRRSKGSGTPLKLAINSMYGKLAQRIGGAPYQNHLWAGLITATTRAWLLDAIGAANSPADIIAVATDGIYTAAPLPLDLGTELGNWEETEHGPMFFCQPGFYWECKDAGMVKTRGMSRDNLGSKTQRLERAWSEMTSRLDRDVGRVPRYPACKVSNKVFMGLRLANAQGSPDRAGSWSAPDEEPSDDFKMTGSPDDLGCRTISFAWGEKRLELAYAARYDGPAGGSLQTLPWRGSPRSRSAPWHADVLTTGTADIDLLSLISDEQPDYYDADQQVIDDEP
jgi:hypothetical protein